VAQLGAAFESAADTGENFDRINGIKMILRRISANPVNQVNPVKNALISDGHRPPLQPTKKA
jgi:hypothetical protein